MPTIPQIPGSAPFTPAQIAWLNSFLAGIFSQTELTAPVPTDAPPSLKIAVLYASQTGTAEGLARKVTKELKTKGHIVSLITLEGYTLQSLAEERYAIFIASTYGEGEAPDAVQPFFEQLCLNQQPGTFADLSFAVLALGDSHYEHFCKFGIDLDHKLAALGGTRICDRINCDVDLDTDFAQWKQSLLAHLDDISTGRQPRKALSAIVASAPTRPLSATPVHTRDNPFFAPVVDKRALTHDVSSKLTLHCAFSINGSPVTYEAGDALGVIPQNDPALVDEILQTLRFDPDVPVALPAGGGTSLGDALLNHLQITRLTRKMVEAYATIGHAHSGLCQPLLGLLAPEQQTHLNQHTFDRDLIDLLHEHPGVLRDPADLVAMLPKLTPRLYSISSSPYAHAGEVHTTVAVVRYRSQNRNRCGVCSTLIADRTPTGHSLPIYIQPNKKFRLPKEMDTSIIMIGPGTGIAPFRAFLHERRALGSTGRNWLFFGERSANTDFLYRDELESMVADRHLSRLDLAFSRDQEHKIYVQDRMLEQAQILWNWLQEGARIYVCGDASRMAKDVDRTLHRIVEQQGDLDTEAAKDYVQQLKDDHRYHRDVY